MKLCSKKGQMCPLEGLEGPQGLEATAAGNAGSLMVSESLQGPHHSGVVCKDCSLLVLGWEGSLKLQRTWRPGPRGLQYNSDHTEAGLLRGLEDLSSS